MVCNIMCGFSGTVIPQFGNSVIISKSRFIVVIDNKIPNAFVLFKSKCFSLLYLNNIYINIIVHIMGDLISVYIIDITILVYNMIVLDTTMYIFYLEIINYFFGI